MQHRGLLDKLSVEHKFRMSIGNTQRACRNSPAMDKQYILQFAVARAIIFVYNLQIIHSFCLLQPPVPTQKSHSRPVFMPSTQCRYITGTRSYYCRHTVIISRDYRQHIAIIVSICRQAYKEQRPEADMRNGIRLPISLHSDSIIRGFSRYRQSRRPCLSSNPALR